MPGRQIADAVQMFRDSSVAVTADADSDYVRIPGGNLHTPMGVEIEFWDAATGSGTGSVKFTTKRCATAGGSYVVHVSEVGGDNTVALTTTAKKGRIFIPFQHGDDFTKVGVDGTGTGWTIKYTAKLVTMPAGG